MKHHTDALRRKLRVEKTRYTRGRTGGPPAITRGRATEPRRVIRETAASFVAALSILGTMRVLLTSTLVLALAGCDSTGRSGEPLSFTPTEWDVSWVDGNGSEVPNTVLQTYSGPEHCDWQQAAFLSLAWPPGTEEDWDTARQYARDPARVLPPTYFEEPLDLEAALPPTARDTGYRLGEAELWLADDVASAVYVVRKGRVERWPRARPVLACA